MIKKINQYLLTHHPLLWNTRVTWVILINIILHLLFMVGGFASVYPSEMQHYYSISSPGEETMGAFSILCSIAVIIFWLVFYLRNNAFKSFYNIDKYHLIKESLLVLLIIFSSITYFESFCIGVKLKTRAITSPKEFAAEVNTINIAKAFIPQSKADYFILNTRNSDGSVNSVYHDGYDYSDSAMVNATDTDFMKVNAALKRPGAFSYLNYSTSFISYSDYKQNIDNYPVWYNIKNSWIINGQKDSIRKLLTDFFAICQKYSIKQTLDANTLTDLVFANPNHNVTRTFGSAEEYSDTVNYVYLSNYGLTMTEDFISKCEPGKKWSIGTIEDLVVEIYIALSLSLILLCFRWYNRKVFLISFIGTIVWTIIFTLIGIASRRDAGDVVSWSYLVLFAFFFLTVITGIKNFFSKTISGVIHIWHMYMMPFVVMWIASLFKSYYFSQFIVYDDYKNREEIVQKTFPISYWITEHSSEIIAVNLIAALIYLVFYFTHVSKKWHLRPEE